MYVVCAIHTCIVTACAAFCCGIMFFVIDVRRVLNTVAQNCIRCNNLESQLLHGEAHSVNDAATEAGMTEFSAPSA